MLANPANVQPRFSVFQNVSSAVAVVTISLPANAGRSVHLLRALISSSAGCNLAQELNASSATTTVVTPSNLGSQAGTSAVVAYTASNIAASAQITHTLPITAATLTQFDLSHIYLAKNANAKQSFTLRTDNATGTNGITLIWEEVTTF